MAAKGNRRDRASLGRRDWAVVEAAGLPVRHVAARTIRHRLDAVWDEVRGAVRHPADAERVHRLRVATRRTLAAFEAFDGLLPPRRRIWFRRRLRDLRRAAGETRDLDVLTTRLTAGSGDRPAVRSPESRRARARLVAMLSRQREISRQPIRDVYESLVAADWTGRVERLVARVAAGRHQTPFGRYGRRRLRRLVLRFFGRADRRLRSAEELHALRIEGKKLRYALEIFAGVLSPDVRHSCEDALERLQATLGAFTDHAAAADRFRRWARDERMVPDRETLAELRRQESALADEARRRFAKWWNGSRRRSLRQTFERSLQRDSA